MERRLCRIITVLVLSLVVWVVFLVLTEVSADYPDTAAVVRAGGEFPWQHFVIYVNAGVFTLLTTAAFAGFAALYGEDFPFTSKVAMVFIPIYGFGCLVAYLSQVFILPAAGAQPEAWLFQLIQNADGTVMQFINALAYAVLGIPSVLFGGVLIRDPVASSVGGTLLIISGILSWIALIGVAAGSAALMLMSLISGGVFLVAMIIIAARLSKS